MRGHLIVDADFDRGITRRGIIVEIAEQDGHQHPLRFPDARLHARAVLAPATGVTVSAAANGAADDKRPVSGLRPGLWRRRGLWSGRRFG